MRACYSVILYSKDHANQNIIYTDYKFSDLKECTYMHVSKRKLNILLFFFYTQQNAIFYSTHHIRNQHKTCFFFSFVFRMYVDSYSKRVSSYVYQ